MPAESRHSSTQGPFISSCSVFCSMTWKWQYLQIHKVMWRFITCSFSPLVVYSPLVDHESEGSLPGKESGGCRGWIGADISQGSPSTPAGMNFAQGISVRCPALGHKLWTAPVAAILRAILISISIPSSNWKVQIRISQHTGLEFPGGAQGSFVCPWS